MKFTRIESTHLSNGDLIEVTKAGRTYTFMQSSPVISEAPFVTLGLNKKTALDMFADALQADVCEV